MRLEFEIVLVAEREGVVDLAVEEKPDVRVGEDAERLHAVDLVGDRKPVEAKKRVRNLSQRFDACGVRTAVRDLE